MRITSIAAAQIPQSLFILYSYTGDAAEQQTLVESIIAAGINSLFITTVDGYTAWSALMAQFCSAMDLT
jgi:ABC-type sugar transport system substrate-binding protein